MNRSPIHKPMTIGRILERFATSEHVDIPHKVRALAILENQILSLLPPEFATHCRVAGVRGDRLLLVADTPAWAARLRFRSAQLVKHLVEHPGRSGVVTVRTVQVRIIPPVTEVKPTPRRTRLSVENAQLLEQTARGIQDPRLAQALARLARRSR